jgi:hypothetical protein
MPNDNILAPAGSWLGRQLADLSMPRAAVAGVLTHLPGLFYIAALNAVTNSTSSIVNQIFQVAVYNAFGSRCRPLLWFSPPVDRLSCRTSCAV